MTVVIDASVAVASLLNDGQARHVLSSERLHAPHLIDSEVVSTFRRLVLSGTLRVDEAQAALMTWQDVGLRRFPAAGFISRMWELRDNVAAYDATYVALAEQMHCALVTADRRLAGAAGPRCQVTVVSR